MKSNTVIFTVSCIVLVSSMAGTHGLSDERQKREITDRRLTMDVLLELLDTLRSSEIKNKRHLPVDAGYGSRYDVVNRLSSKLMAMQQAADWNSPGRK